MRPVGAPIVALAVLAAPAAQALSTILEVHLESSVGREDLDHRLVQRKGAGGAFGTAIDYASAKGSGFGFAFSFAAIVSGGKATSVDPLDSGVWLRYRLETGLGLSKGLGGGAAVGIFGVHMSDDTVRSGASNAAYNTGTFLRTGLLREGLELTGTYSFINAEGDRGRFRELDVTVQVPVKGYRRMPLALFASVAWSWQIEAYVAGAGLVPGGQGSAFATRVGVGFTPE